MFVKLDVSQAKDLTELEVAAKISASGLASVNFLDFDNGAGGAYDSIIKGGGESSSVSSKTKTSTGSAGKDNKIVHRSTRSNASGGGSSGRRFSLHRTIHRGSITSIVSETTATTTATAASKPVEGDDEDYSSVIYDEADEDAVGSDDETSGMYQSIYLVFQNFVSSEMFSPLYIPNYIPSSYLYL